MILKRNHECRVSETLGFLNTPDIFLASSFGLVSKVVKPWPIILLGITIFDGLGRCDRWREFLKTRGPSKFEMPLPKSRSRDA